MISETTLIDKYQRELRTYGEYEDELIGDRPVEKTRKKLISLMETLT
jgi:hypothetical protein